MKKYYLKIFLWGCLAWFLSPFTARAQVITNLGDTLSIGAGSVLYINGDMSLAANGSNPAYVKNNGTINITGNLSAATSTQYNGKSDSLLLSGGGAQTFSGLTYGSVVVRNGGVKSIAGNTYIKYKLLITRGSILTGNDTMRLDSLATIKESVTDYLMGNLVITRNLNSNTTYTNGNIGLDVITATTAPGITTIFRKNGITATQNGFCSSGIERYFDIRPAYNHDLSANIVFHYLPIELNGASQGDLEVFRSKDTGKTWETEGYTFRNAAQNSISLNGMDTLGRFTLGTVTSPIVNALKAGAPQVLCSGKTTNIGGTGLSGHIYFWSSAPAGFSSNLASPAVSPKVTTTYYLLEKVTTAACQNKDSVTITVIPSPTATWKFSNNGPVYSFKADDTTQTSYAWDFGDGNSASGFKATHLFAKDGTYKISLIVTGSNGCSTEVDSTRLFRVGIKPGNLSAIDFKIFPNPFSGNTNISFNLEHTSHVHVTLTDMTGRELGIIAHGQAKAGEYQFEINSNTYHLQPGIYFVKTMIDDDMAVSRIVKAGY